MIGMALFAVLMCVNFTSCDKEEEETATIYGEWRMVSAESWRYDDGELVYHNLDEDWDEYIIIIGFNEDGTYYSIEEGYEIKSTYNYKDGMLTIGVGEEGSYKVIKLTTSTLVLERTQVYDGDKKIYKKTYNRVK